MIDVPQVLQAALRQHQAGQFAEAEVAYRQILAVAPSHTDALHLLGLVCHQTGRADLAIDFITAALRTNPAFAEAHYNLGKAYQDAQRIEDAVRSYERAVELRPAMAEAWFNLGNARRELARLDDAVTAFRAALRARPSYAKALTNLGSVLTELHRDDEAVAVLSQALSLQPENPRIHNNLGNAFRGLSRLPEAQAAFRRAIELDPLGAAEPYNNLGTAQMDNHELDAAHASFRRAIELKPDYANAHMNRAMNWLLMGDFARGWPEYEWRWEAQPLRETRPPAQPPRWDGAPGGRHTVLLTAEQGLGDTLQFIRYAPLVKQRCRELFFLSPKALAPLLSRTPGIDRLLTDVDSTPPYSAQAPLLSIPGILGTRAETIPADVPYLFPDPDLVRHWQRELSAVAAFKVGVAWQGNPNHRSDRHRSIPLARFAPLARVGGVRLVSLQKGHGVEQLAAASGLLEITDLGRQLDETAGPFMDTAAVIKCLDLVVTSDTAIAHLAGALGAPVWVALPFAPDWRWTLRRSDSPWYPTMRLFRQPKPGDWESVFEEIAGALFDHVHAAHTVRK
jgi:tetratricopeptide (TPR) repeat protein